MSFCLMQKSLLTRNVDENNKSNRSWELVMSNFTDDLWIEILIRLPLKFLLQLKSVSKSWLNIISSHRFAKSHLDRAITSGEDVKTLIVHLLPADEDGPFSLFDLRSANVNKNLRFPYSQGEYPFVPPSHLFGFDCGIASVSVDVSDWPAAKNKNDIYLWNPTTKHSKRIPPHTILDDFNSARVALGFGFDCIDFDFKVVRLLLHTFSAEVYSSNTNAWQKIEPNPIDAPFYGDFDLCLHGFLLAMGCNGMMAFDLNKEVFVCHIKFPFSFFDARITDFNDSIAVYMFKELEGKIKLWTLDDEACLRGSGVEASWTLMLSIDLGDSFFVVEGPFNNVEFLLMAGHGDRYLYDFTRERIKYLRYAPFFGSREIFKFTESLFSVAGSKRVEWTASSSRLLDEPQSDMEIVNNVIPI